MGGLCRSKTCPVPRVLCKRRADPCKSWSVQKFVLTLVNWVSVSLVKIKADVNSQPDAVCGT